MVWGKAHMNMEVRVDPATFAWVLGMQLGLTSGMHSKCLYLMSHLIDPLLILK